ncbi:MAG: amidophosphoribosyltransferase [Casimicrobiaceae bacterium]|nr:amidophosphoribosyltransferase [Casimicrobiaceae bacterium]MCX8098084.1 amidophosphoribosyltransferase [Casimicrobiaceae bacterium]MDW8313105.1 amidophosphoribosyltransferase [Burkholderiales bacterium]
MCGVLGIVSHGPVNQILYDGLLTLQHRGQDAAGILTTNGAVFHMHKGKGMVRDIFRTRNMRDLLGNAGIGHVRYPTAGSAGSADEAQPFYVNSPFGVALAHNGNLTNAEALKRALFELDARHINTDSDSEVLLNVFAHELQRVLAETEERRLTPERIFRAVRGVHARCRGAYAVTAMIAGHGLVAFRDPYGIRPLVFGCQESMAGPEYAVASETVALDVLGFEVVRDVAPGEAIFIDFAGQLHTERCADTTRLTPCIFEFVYLARPDSVIDGVSVYDARVRLGAELALQVAAVPEASEIDVVIPIPDSSRPAALELAHRIGRPYREGFVKNRYVGRTFIMPGQAMRKKSVRQKLNPIASEFRGKTVLLVDDSIVRGTTSREIVQMARESGARKVLFASASPPVRFPNVYGIDMPTQAELIAVGKSDAEIAQAIGADRVIYQTIEGMKRAIRAGNAAIDDFDASCFDGCYVTGDITSEFLQRLAQTRDESRGEVLATEP